MSEYPHHYGHVTGLGGPGRTRTQRLQCKDCGARWYFEEQTWQQAEEDARQSQVEACPGRQETGAKPARLK